MRPFVRLLTLALFAALPLGSHAGVVSEQLHFLDVDGVHANLYTTSRADYDNYTLWFRDRDGVSGERHLDSFLYLYPNRYDWESRAGYSLLKLPERSFAGMERIDLTARGAVTVDGDGLYTFTNWPDKAKTPDGHYGLWNAPNDFDKLAYTWVFPANLEAVSYEANRKGEWVSRHNTLTFYADDVNDVVFKIAYRPTSHGTYQSLRDRLRGMRGKGLALNQLPEWVSVSVEAKLLYPTGVAELSAEGKRVLDEIALALMDRPSVYVVVEGHADIVPIGPALKAKYPTNWELSSARSINVIHYLVAQGVAEERFESRAFSNVCPAGCNEEAAGRQQNRRIELLFIDDEK